MPRIYSDMAHAFLALESCIHLAGLELFSLVVPSIRATSFWKVCSGLKCLGFFHCAIPEIPGRVQVDPSVLQNNMLAPLQSPQQQQQQQQLREKDLVTCFPRLEKLYWQQVLDFSETSFVQLLKTMPSLKSLSWQTSRDNTSNTLSASESMVVGLGRHAEFGHFKHLHSLELSDPQCTDQALSAILSCLSNLTVLSVPGTGFGPLAFQALKQTRVLYNLKELVLEDCDAVTSTMIQEIMTRCTELEVLEAGILYSSDILSSLTAMDQENGHVIDNDDNDGKDATSWACVKLKRLAVTIAMNSISAEQRWRSAFWQSQNRWRMKARVKDQKRVLAKLATLTRLEYLELRGTARVEGRWGEQDASISSSSSSSSSLPLDCVLDLQLQKGLDQLAPLVQLCEFQVPSCAQHMDILEIEWMLEQWPLLQRVSGQFNVNRIVNNELTQILNDRGIAS
ncbi:hypothetical protein BGZ94_008133 [Podila epigama]|nr:hypothetical protein BGZ94_008133 [Podila epigama]